MRPSAGIILSLLLLFGALPARAAMRDALSTAQLLSGLVDARVVRMELPLGLHSAPKRIHALAIAFDDVLWLYTPGLGTSILGPVHSADKLRSDEIADRLRQLAPALNNIRVYANPLLPSTGELSATLSQACFAGCLLDLASLLTRSEGVDEAGIIFFSGPVPTRSSRAPTGLNDIGHSLLVYRLAGRWFMIDPARPADPLNLGGVNADTELDPALTAYATRSGYALDRVRFLPFSTTALARLTREARWRERLLVKLPEN